MTTQECYEAMGADYESVITRLRKDERVERFLLKVPEDPNYDLLCKSLEERNMEEAFRAVHTIKGICQNLSLDRLGAAAENLTELLRDRTEYISEIDEAFAEVKKAYDEMVDCVSRFVAEK